MKSAAVDTCPKKRIAAARLEDYIKTHISIDWSKAIRFLATLLGESFEDIAETEEPNVIAYGIINELIKSEHIAEIQGRIYWKQQASGTTDNDATTPT